MCEVRTLRGNREVSATVKTALLMLFLVFVFPRPLVADQTVTVAWNPPSTGAAGYYVYWGSQSGVYTSVFDAGTNTTINVNGLQEGRTNFFMVVGYNSARLLGTAAPEISYLAPGCLRLGGAPSSNGAVLSFPVTVGHSYAVEASTNLQTWTTIWQSGTSTSNAWVSCLDPQSRAYPERFYRLIMN
jgi:hypothetical protein